MPRPNKFHVYIIFIGFIGFSFGILTGLNWGLWAPSGKLFHLDHAAAQCTTAVKHLDELETRVTKLNKLANEEKYQIHARDEAVKKHGLCGYAKLICPLIHH